MSDNILDDLDSLLSTQSIGDETFRNELSYYSGLKNVTVDREIISVYDRKASVATNAARIIKSDKHTIKVTNRSIQESEISYDRESEEMRKRLVPEIRAAKRKWRDSNVFSKEAKQARQQLDGLKRQYRDKNRNRHKIKERIAEDRTRLAEKEAEIKEQTQKLNEAKTYMQKLEKGIRRQFDALNKMLATRDYIKVGGIDLNNPNLSRETKQALINFTNLAKKNLKISIVEPLTDQSSELMQAFTRVQATIKDDDKKKIQTAEQQRVSACKGYVKRLQEDPSLDNLDTGR